MKPKFRSNTAMLVLLLFFYLPAWSEVLCGDTIIIDGEYISIVRDTSSADVDSLEQSKHRRKDRLNLDLGASLLPSLNLGNLYFAGTEGVLLNRFIQKGNSLRPSYSFGLGATKHFSDLLAVRLGVNHGRLDIRNPYIDPDDLSDEETYAFASFEEGKFSQIVNVFIDPGYELDTLDIPVMDGKFQFTVTDVVLRMAVYPEPLKEKFRMYIHFGPFLRLTTLRQDSPVNVIVGDDQIKAIPGDDLGFRTTMVGGTLGFGFEYEQKRHLFGSSLDGWVPAGLMNEHPEIEIMSGTLSLGFHYAYRF